VKRLSKALTNLIVIAIAIPYFLLDAMFAAVAIPLSRWIAGHWAFARVHRWILSLRPYPTLLLFTVPVIVLEPVKPVPLSDRNRPRQVRPGGAGDRRDYKTGADRTAVQRQPRQAAVDPGLRLGLRQILGGQVLADVIRGVADHHEMEPERSSHGATLCNGSARGERERRWTGSTR
jgi:hypothetical protein